MSQLKAVIDYAERSVTFSGRGTFHAKEDIKNLGPARWVSDEKVWRVKPIDVSPEKLNEIFPELSVEEVGNPGSSEAPSVETGSSELKVDSPPADVSSDVSSKLPASLSVSEFVFQARKAIKAAFSKRVFVHGVVISAKEYGGGRVYIELAELERPQERVNCVIWRNSDQILKGLTDAGFRLEPDLQVMFEAEVDLSPRDARISLSIVSIVAEYTIAKLAAQREVTNERLKKEGLFDRNRELSLPFLPTQLGILTSSGGTVINDFRNSLDEAKFGFQLVWCSVNVQGSRAKEEIVAGLETLSKVPGLEVILLFRGGGSPAELAVFNDYEVAKAICRCPLPVISAIGHQEDQSSAQDVSFRAFGVPKDIGRFFADIVLDYRTRVYNALHLVRTILGAKFEHYEKALSLHSLSLVQGARQILSTHRELLVRLEESFHRLAMRSVTSVGERFASLVGPIQVLSTRAIQSRYQELARIGERLGSDAKRLAERFAEQVTNYEKLISQVGPDVQLKRGFSIVRKVENDTLVTRGSALQTADLIELEFADGKTRATVK